MSQYLLRRSLLGTGLALTLGVLATPALAQAPRPVASSSAAEIQPATISNRGPAQAGKDDSTEPGVHQMVILNGPTRTVRYFAPGASPGEQTALKQLEQSENELALNDSLQALRQQYVNTESLMEARRREEQSRLYGLSMNDRTSSSATYSGVGLGQPSPFGTPSLASYPGWMGGWWGNPGSAYGTNQVTLSQESSTNQSLANGIGDEGQFKTAMVREMARQANPEAAATALHNYQTALANVGSLRSGGVTLAAAETTTPHKVVVSLKDGEKVSGLLVRQDGGWITIRTGDSVEQIRMTDVTRIKMDVAR